MTNLLPVLLALSCGASAQQPSALPDAPSALRQAPAAAGSLDAQTRKKLHDAIFLPKPVLQADANSAYRLEKIDDDKWQDVGHKDVTAQLQAAPQGRTFDAFPASTGLASRTKTDSVELSFLQPAPGMTLGVGYSERREWLGSYRGPTQTAGFAVLRITLGPSERKPTVFLPEARVSERKDFQGEKVDHYSIDDLPQGLRP